MFTDTDNQTLTFDQNTNFLTIANGNAVDLSPLAGGGGASALSGLSDVDTTSAGHVPTDGSITLVTNNGTLDARKSGIFYVSRIIRC